MLESVFQARLIEELEYLFEGCVILKNDANIIQGFPDLTILFNENWAVLECKKSANEPFRPNQEYYLQQLGRMSFAACIYPENKEEVLHALEQSLRTRRKTRVPQRI